MEDATFHTLQEIKKLQQKTSTYRDTLNTLKTGTSLEDYLVVKDEFDILKQQISHIDGQTETRAENQYTQQEGYDEQVQQFSAQLKALNQTVEEMNQVILSISNNFSYSKNEGIIEGLPATTHKGPHTNIFNSKSRSISDIAPNYNPSQTVSYQPSYMELRNLAGQVAQPQEFKEEVAPVEHTRYEGNTKHNSHFNRSYFQSRNRSINHNSYEGLNNNTPSKTSIHFKNIVEQQDLLISDFKNSHSPTPLTNEPEKGTTSPVLNNVLENISTPVLDTVEPGSESATAYNVSIAPDFEPEMLTEKAYKQEESPEIDSKKEKNNWLYNIFRK